MLVLVFSSTLTAGDSASDGTYADPSAVGFALAVALSVGVLDLDIQGLTVRVPPNIAQALKLPPGSLGYRVIGVRHSENGPFQHVTAWVPEPI